MSMGLSLLSRSHRSRAGSGAGSFVCVNEGGVLFAVSPASDINGTATSAGGPKIRVIALGLLLTLAAAGQVQGASRAELLALAGGVGSACLDAASTNEFLKMPRTREGNPLQRPFVGGANFVSAQPDVVIPWVIAMKTRGRKRKIAWIVFAVDVGAHTYCAVHNYRAIERGRP